MRIVTLPVYSKLADDQDVPPEIKTGMPTGWHLSAHQVETYQALKSGNADIVFNGAMTGDGKSLAAYLPVLVNNAHAFGMYPTIELLRDQARGFEGYCSEFQCPVTCLPLWGSEMTRLAKNRV
jgi:CRISPR-associated endonuclease/helicase Cas3